MGLTTAAPAPRPPRLTVSSGVVSRKRHAAYVGKGSTSGRSKPHPLSACSPKTCAPARRSQPARARAARRAPARARWDGVRREGAAPGAAPGPAGLWRWESGSGAAAGPSARASRRTPRPRCLPLPRLRAPPNHRFPARSPPPRLDARAPRRRGLLACCATAARAWRAARSY
jgi:hypothetical protein